MDRIDCAVIGAGVIGLAVARALALGGREVVILEAADAIGTETSSRNSEVIHAGIYYPQGSLMARSCVSGREMLYAYCRERGIAHRQCGKLIVATDEAERERLAAIRDRAARNGVHDISLLDADEARALEPALSCSGALLSPSTGIIDSHAYMLSLQGEAEAAGAMLALLSPVETGRGEGGEVVLEVGGAAPATLACRLVVNCAGLHAPDLARRFSGLAPASVPPAYFAKGNYFTLSTRAPFSRLIYPVPVPGGLGTHLTLDLGGNVRFGPDVEWTDRIDYDVDPARAGQFYAAIRRYWPELQDGSLQPGYAGIRAKIVPPETAVQDFLVQDGSCHGLPGLINMFGIESPGLTASLALAEHVRAMSEAAAGGSQRPRAGCADSA